VTLRIRKRDRERGARDASSFLLEPLALFALPQIDIIRPSKYFEVVGIDLYKK
jgi:hypothetical protein